MDDLVSSTDGAQPDVSDLGAFLTRRRALARPAAAGFPAQGARRVEGLRREEVALLADMSVDYYIRLEQGRERHPSRQILLALSRALQLDDGAREHLFRVAGTSQVPTPAADDHVTDELRGLLAQLDASPALVIGHDLDVLARNEMAWRLHSGFELHDNSARMCFLDPLGRTFYDPWATAAEGVVAALRFAAGQWSDDQRLTEVVQDLRATSPDFARLWRSQSVGPKRNETKRLHHPAVGLLLLDYQSFDVRGAAGQQLVVFTPAARSDARQRLAELRSLPLPEPLSRVRGSDPVQTRR